MGSKYIKYLKLILLSIVIHIICSFLAIPKVDEAVFSTLSQPYVVVPTLTMNNESVCYIENLWSGCIDCVCNIESPYIRIIRSLLLNDTFSHCNDTNYINRKLQEWRTQLPDENALHILQTKYYPSFAADEKCKIIQQNIFIDINKICKNLFINKILVYSSTKYASNCKWSMKHLNWNSLYIINTLYRKDFEIFNFTQYDTPINQSPIVQKTWDIVAHFEDLYSVPHFDYEPLLASNESNICKTNYDTTYDTIHTNYAYNITVGLCTSVRNELPYLFEWIEYYTTIQEIDKIYIYNDRSQDRTEYLSYFYSKYMLNYAQIEIIPHIRGQFNAWAPCRERALNDNITWLANIDVDEFIYTINPKFKSIKQFVNYIHFHQTDITEIEIAMRPFGSKPTEKKFKYDLTINVSAKHCANASDFESLKDCNIDMINANKDGIVTVIGQNLYRKADNAGVLHSRHCSLFGRRGGVTGSVCSEGVAIKSIYKTPLCVSPSTHMCQEWKSGVNASIYWNVTQIIGNHYLLRGFENFFAFPFDKPDKKVLLCDEDINAYFRSVYDPEIANRYDYYLSKRLSELLHCN